MNTRFFMITIMLLGISFQVRAQQTFPPSAYDGQDGLKDLIEKELVYPRKALRDSVEGMVNLFFIVDKNGTTRDLKVWQSLSEETDKEATRLFKKVLWHPARVGGMAMSSEHYLRVEFDLGKYRKMVMARGYDTLPAIIEPIDTSEIVWEATSLDTIATPIIPDGEETLANFLSRQVQYPDDAFDQSIDGVVELEFVVEQHGGVSNIRVGKWLGGGCYEEAERLCRSIRWIPAIKNGKAVRSFATMRLDFELPKDPRLDH